MRVAVGSRNPVKAGAVEDALRGLPGVVIETVAVDSGVSEQPRGRSETVRGAENRARRAIGSGAYDLGVGIEGGIDDSDELTGTFLIMWAAVTDGERVEFGSGPSMRLPDEVSERLRDGAELGPVMDDLLGTNGIAEGKGAIGVLTDGEIDRRDALRTAVAGALGPYVTGHY